MISTPFDDRPWKHLGSDLFCWKGHAYLLVVCYYSRFIELAKLSSATSEEFISHLKSFLAAIVFVTYSPAIMGLATQGRLC